ncbi:MAG TPA: SH3 domain-containing protein, partial [Acidobacteriota bacterium]
MTKFDSVIPPGSEGKVYSSVDISHAKGPIEKFIELKTNDPQHTNFRLAIKANVKMIVDVQPQDSIRFLTQKGQAQTEERTLVPSFNVPLTLGTPVTDVKIFDTKIAKGKAGNYSLTAVLKPEAPIGNHSGSITIPVSGGPVKEIVIPVYAVVRGPIQVSQQSVAFVIRSYPDEVTPQEPVNLTQKEAPSSNVVAKSNPGVKLRVISQRGDMYQVVTPDNVIGWLAKSSVKTLKQPEIQTAQNISIRKNNGQNFKVLTYNSSLPQVKIEMQPAAAGQMASSFDIKVTLV